MPPRRLYQEPPPIALVPDEPGKVGRGHPLLPMGQHGFQKFVQGLETVHPFGRGMLQIPGLFHAHRPPFEKELLFLGNG